MEKKTKSYRMLKTVPGSRDGLSVETFNKGTTYDDLPEGLVENLYHLGAIEEVAGRKNPADTRETKVTAPAESKEGEAGVPLGTQHVEELVAVARDVHGLDVDSTMTEAQLRKAIEGAEKAQAAAKDEPRAKADDKKADKKK